MEEFVGEIWHRIVSSKAQTDYDSAKVELAGLNQQLAPFYRGLGGCPGKLIEGAAPRRFNSRRSFIQRVAGSHKRFAVSWQDERSVRLPPLIACFADAELNRDLYFWLTAMAATLPTIKHWFVDNQRATLALLKAYPGLAKRYQRLVDNLIPIRPCPNHLDRDEQQRELAIQSALRNPGSVTRLPLAKGDPMPVALWLYPQPIQDISPSPEDAKDNKNGGNNINSSKKSHDSSTRKSATRAEDRNPNDGLLVFQLPSLFTMAEQVDLDRCQDEDQDDPASAADDLDIISLSRQRRAGGGTLRFDLDLPGAQNDDLPLGRGSRFPEWDFRRGTLIKDYCLVQPMVADQAQPQPIPEHLAATARQLKRQFSVLQPQTHWQSRQPWGDELDLDAWIEYAAEPEQNSERQDFYRAQRACQRDLACLALADLSMSTDSMLSEEQRVIDVIRDALVLFAEAMDACGDRFALYGFSSVRNSQVRYNLLKNFAEPYSAVTRGRILAIRPGFYTRMGAAIRQSTAILEQQPARQRLLLMISDGKPNDLDHYEGRYGIEDTRQAVIEARQKGLIPFCVTIDEDGSDYLPYVFGERGYALVSHIAKLPLLLPALYLQLTGQNP
ncbi:MAG: VWA domain-containing protein [Porticoccaceae bacterium]|nr:VWA domain-containing protein [Porticoccaceae bacterium]